MSTSSRNSRINDLLQAQCVLLTHIEKTGGTIRAKDGRNIAGQLVANQSRRDSVWTTVINAGYLQPRGKGVYLLTEAGKIMAKYWREEIDKEADDILAKL